jgi:hypothetical protein
MWELAVEVGMGSGLALRQKVPPLEQPGFQFENYLGWQSVVEYCILKGVSKSRKSKEGFVGTNFERT